MDFVAAFYDWNLKGFSAVGMNCLGRDWDTLYNKLRWKHNIVAGDVKAFGPTIPHSIINDVYSVINAWYGLHTESTDKSGTVRKVLGKEATESLNVAYDCLFETPCCSPSGQPLTILVNTVSMAMYLYMAYEEIMRDAKRADLANPQDYKRLIDTVVNGDDMIQSVSPEIERIYDNIKLSNKLEEHGVGYTDIRKEKVQYSFEKLEEVSFLGRKFTKLEEHNVGALDEDMIRDVVNWTRCRSAKNLMGHMVSTTQGVLTEAMFYGQTKHEEIFMKLAKYWSKRGVDLSDFTYTNLFNRWVDGKLSEEDKLTWDCAGKHQRVREETQNDS